MPVNGLVTMTPTSIASTGTGNSSSINTNGSVTFSSCATLSLNGVFTSSYDNYMVTMRSVAVSATAGINFRLRASGTDNSTASSYVNEYLETSGTTLNAGRTTATSSQLSNTTSTSRDGLTFYLFGPKLAQATAFRTLAVYDGSTVVMLDTGGTHNQSTAYDGISFIFSNVVTGLVTVYGFNQ